MKIVLFFFFLLSIPNFSLALNVDEKLTIRFLRLSSTKKTVLVNRGLEDGLAVGDHAKFFVTTGVIARGLVVKVSPSRSIWSLYRVVTPEALITDRMANIKISSPVKLTNDPSKSVYGDDISLQIPDTIPLAAGADDLNEEDILSEEPEQEDLAFIQEDVSTEKSSKSSESSKKSLEIFTLANYNLLGSSSDLIKNNSTEEADSYINFSLGLEKYFNSNGLLNDISLTGIVRMGTQEIKLFSGSTSQGESSTSSLEYGMGLNYHFFRSPRNLNNIIGFVAFNGGMGTVIDSFTASTTSSTTSRETAENNGTLTFFSLGTGIKYFLSQTLGFRIVVDYYTRSEQYNFENTDNNYTRKTSGPRVSSGFSYHF